MVSKNTVLSDFEHMQHADMRDKYDPTSAYLVLNNMRSKSNLYARNLYQWCRKQIKYAAGMSFNPAKWKEPVRKYENMSAQGWIDLYTFLLRGEYGECNNK